MPDAELAEDLLSKKGALNKVGNNVTQTTKRMSDAKKQVERPPFADETNLMARVCMAALGLQNSDDLKHI